MTYLGCDGTLTINGSSFTCSGNWIAVTDTQLLTEALATRIMSKEDFIELSGFAIAIFLVAIGIRLVLRQLSTKESSHD